jgi:putative transposase
MLRREGEPLGIKHIYRLYREESLGVRRRKGRKRAVGVHAPILVMARPNARRSLDFVHDQMANGRRFRVLNFTEDITHECLGAIPDTSISGHRMARELTTIIERRGKPRMIVSDNGAELTSNAIFAWRKDQKIDGITLLPLPGSGLLANRERGANRSKTALSIHRQAKNEDFNGKMRDEQLNETLFFSLDHARSIIAAWMEDNNTIRPHSPQDYPTRAAYAEKFTATCYHTTPLRRCACQPVAQPTQPGIQTPETPKAAV